VNQTEIKKKEGDEYLSNLLKYPEQPTAAKDRGKPMDTEV
jgi:hypothetical protein